MFSINRTSIEQRSQIVSLLVEGNGINAITRITGIAKNTVLKLLADLAEACEACHDEHVRCLISKHIQADEIWSFCYAKQKNVPADSKGRWAMETFGRGLRLMLFSFEELIAIVDEWEVSQRTTKETA